MESGKAMSHAVAEIDRAISDFARPSTMRDFDTSRVRLSDHERRALEESDAARERAVQAAISRAIPSVVRTDVHYGRDDRAYVYIFVQTDREKRSLTGLPAEDIKRAVYEALLAERMFKDGSTKLKLVIDSVETVDREFDGNFYLRSKAP